MEKLRYYFSALLLLFFFTASAQDIYRPFPTANALWSQSLTIGPEPYYFENYTCSDTVFDDITYTKIFTHALNFGVEFNYFLGGLREVGKQVFFYKVPENVEFLLYDFSLQVGDTVQVKRIVGQNATPFSMRVLVIDSVNLADGIHKRWKMKHILSADFPEYWIEGIGSAAGPVSHDLGELIGDLPTLKCFQQNGISIYSAPFSGSVCNYLLPTECQEIVAVQSPENDLPIALPNPFSDDLTVSLPDSYARCKLSLYNCFGKLLRTTNISNQSTFTWQRDHLPDGIYFLKIENTGKNVRASVLKVIAL